MSEEAQFLKAIADDPLDPTARMAFADWLEDRGDSRAPWVRDKKIFRWMGPNAENPIPKLIQALCNPEDYDPGWEAQNVLPRVGGAAIPALMEVLESGEERSCFEAGQILAQMPSLDDVLPRLLELIRDERDQVRLGAIAAIQNVGPAASAAVPDLVEHLKNTYLDGGGRYEAILALKAIGPGAMIAVPQLVEDLYDPESQASEALVAIGPEVLPEIIEHATWDDEAGMIGKIAWIFKELGEEALPLARELLQHPDRKVRTMAALVLAEDEPETALPHLIAALEAHPAEHEFWDLLEALNSMGEQASPAVPALQAFLPNCGYEAREGLVELLESLGGSDSTVSLILDQLSQGENRLNGLETLRSLEDIPPEAIPHIVACLDDDNDYVITEAIETLQCCETSPELLQTIRGLGDHEEEEVRKAAFVYLLKKGGEHHTADIVRGLSDPSESIRGRVAELIGKEDLIAPEIDAALVQGLDDEVAWVRCQCVYALGRLDPVRAGGRERLMEMIYNDPEEQVRRQILDIVSQFEYSPEETIAIYQQCIRDPHEDIVSTALDELCSAIRWDDLQEEAAGTIPDLVQILDTAPEWLKERAARVLGALGSKAIPVLKERIHSKDATIRGYALEAVAEAEEASQAIIPDLIARLEDSSPTARSHAIAALGNAGESAADAIPQIRRLLHDDNDDVRASASRALGQILPGEEQAPVNFSALVAQLDDEDKSVRYHTVRALRKTGSPDEVIPLLRSKLTDPESDVRHAAIDELAEIGPEAAVAIPDLIAIIQDPSSRDKSDAAQALGKMGIVVEGVIPALCLALKDEDRFVRWFAGNSLKELGANAAEAAIELGEVGLHDNNPDVRRKALSALGAMGENAAPAISHLRDGLTHQDGLVRIESANALGEIGKQAMEAIPDLIRALKDPGWGQCKEDIKQELQRYHMADQTYIEALGGSDQRWRVVEALRKIQSEDRTVLAAFIEALDIEDLYVCESVCNALKEMGSEGENALRDALSHSSEIVKGMARSTLEE